MLELFIISFFSCEWLIARFSFVSVDLSAGWLFCWVDGGGEHSQGRGREGNARVNKIRSDSVICERIVALAKISGALVNW